MKGMALWRRVVAVVGCVMALGAGYAAAAGGLGLVSVFSSGLTGGNDGYRSYDEAEGSDGALWFSAISTNADSLIARVATDGTMTTFAAGLNAGGQPGPMAQGPDGNVWFVDGYPTPSIGKITPRGAITEYPTSPNLYVSGIGAGIDGNVWFTGRDEIGKITPGGQITGYDVGPGPPVTSDPVGIASGLDGAMWFAVRSPAAIGRITSDGTVTEYTAGLPAASAPTQIARGPDGNMWFLDSGAGAIGRITPAGAITEFSPGSPGNLYAISAGADGNMWFTDVAADMIGKITPAGTITEFSVSSYGLFDPLAITTGSDGRLWLTAFDAAHVPQVARVDVGAPPASIAPPAISGSGRQGDRQSCGGAVWSDWAGQQPSSTAFAFDGYQWSLDGIPIAGQDANTYTPTNADVGHELTCQVTATYTLFPATDSATSEGAIVLPSAPGAGSSGSMTTVSNTVPATVPVGATTATAANTTATPHHVAKTPTVSVATVRVTIVRVGTIRLEGKPKLHLTLKVSRAVRVELVLLAPSGKIVARWNVRLVAGTTKLTFALPPKARHKGTDTLRLQAGGGKVESVRVALRP